MAKKLIFYKMALFKQLYRYGDRVNTHDIFKAVAMLLMFVDHAGLYLLDNNTGLRLIGRAAAPLFFFITGTVNNFRFKSNILWYGILLTIITFLTKDSFYLNILINFVFIKFILEYYDPSKSSNFKLWRDFIVLLLVYFAVFSYLEYGTFGVMFAFAGRLIAQKDSRGAYWLAATIIFYYIIESILSNFIFKTTYESLFALLSVLLWASMVFYAFREWHGPKWLRYPTLFLSRYSLQVYFWHLAILMVYASIYDRA